jgi:hypothetical protein
MMCRSGCKLVVGDKNAETNRLLARAIVDMWNKALGVVGKTVGWFERYTAASPG